MATYPDKTCQQCGKTWTPANRMEHRLVMAAMAGRLLTRTEVVDHLNHNPRDNRPENLALYPTNGDHKRGEAGRFVPGVANRWCPRDLERH